VSKDKSYKLSELAKITETTISGDPDAVVDSIATVSSATENSITFISNSKYEKDLNSSKASVVIVSKDFNIDDKFNYLQADDPYLTYAKISKLFKTQIVPRNKTTIHDSAIIEDSSSIGENTFIGANVYIGHNCAIGNNVIIHPNCSIVQDVEISSNTIIHHGTVLGSDGFGFAPTKDGFVKIEQLGKLKIGANVEIGASCTIDRGAIDDTIIEDGVILDNLVHIAHNVILGKNSAIAASCAIAGSSKIGANFQMGGLSGVLGHLNICNNVSVGAHTLITKDINEPGEYVGIMPAQEHTAWAKSSVFIKRRGK